jgi:hypothetical protein
MGRTANRKYTDLRAKLLRKQCSLRSWAIEHNLPVGSVYHAAKGSRLGPKSLKIRKALETFLNK